MTRPTLEERYDEQIAERMLTLSNEMAGLPQYLWAAPVLRSRCCESEVDVVPGTVGVAADGSAP